MIYILQQMEDVTSIGSSCQIVISLNLREFYTKREEIYIYIY